MANANGELFSGLVGACGLVRVHLVDASTGRCTCGAENCRGKHPVSLGWQNLKSNETPREGYGLGVRTGLHTGIFVVDIDGPEGAASFAELVRKHGEFPRTLERKTNRGRHYFFRQPGLLGINTTSKVAPKIDTRGIGGQVVYHAPGYETIADVDGDLPDVPEWFLALLQADTAPVGGARARPPRTPPPGDEQAWRQAAMLLAVHWPANGQRHEAHLALVGGLLFAGWTDEETERFVRLVYSALGEPDNPNIHRNVQTTARRMAADAPTVGWSTLEKHLGRDAVAGGRRALGLAPALERGAIVLYSPEGVPTREKPDPAHVYEWESATVSPDGKLEKCSLLMAKYYLSAHDAWRGKLQWDSRSQNWVAVNPPMRLDAEKGRPSDHDLTRIMYWFQGAVGRSPRRDELRQVLLEQAQSIQFDPVKEYLDGLPRYEAGAREVWHELALLMGNETPAAVEALRNFCVSAVARAYEPGCKVDTMLVLNGQQSYRKSWFAKHLFGEQWVREGLPSIEGKEGAMALRSFWCVEIAEMSSWIRSHEAAKKDFITRQIDTYRPPYAEQDISVPRRCVMLGTINDPEFLTDMTGNRRYLVVEVIKPIDPHELERLRDRVWSAAASLYFAGHKYWIFDEAAQNAVRADFEVEDPWFDAVQKYCDGKNEVQAKDILKEVIYAHDVAYLGKLRSGNGETRRLGGILRKLGFKNSTRRKEGVLGKWWVRASA